VTNTQTGRHKLNTKHLFLLCCNNALETECGVHKTGISSTEGFKINSVYVLTLINLISDIQKLGRSEELVFNYDRNHENVYEVFSFLLI
jgi:hypothetical protein